MTDKERKDNAIKVLTSYLGTGATTLYGMNRGTPNSPKVMCFVIGNYEGDTQQRIINISGMVARVTGLKFADDIAAVKGFRPGYLPIMYLAELVANAIGIRFIPTETL